MKKKLKTSNNDCLEPKNARGTVRSSLQLAFDKAINRLPLQFLQ